MKKEEILDWLEKYDACDLSKVKINKDGTVDVNGDVDFSWKKVTNIPFQFGIVGGYFDCSYNQLTSLEGAPKEVGGGFHCYYNQLTTLEGAPKEVGRSFYCNNNKLQFTEEDVKRICKVKEYVYC